MQTTNKCRVEKSQDVGVGIISNPPSRRLSFGDKSLDGVLKPPNTIAEVVGIILFGERATFRLSPVNICLIVDYILLHLVQIYKLYREILVILIFFQLPDSSISNLISASFMYHCLLFFQIGPWLIFNDFEIQ